MTKEQALSRLTALCARGEHCCHDVTEKMRRWEIGEHEQAEIVAYLLSERYIDEERYARFFINDKVKYNRWGRRKVEQALRLKRIDEKVYRPLLDEIDETDDYKDTLRRIIEIKKPTIKAKNDYDLRSKLIRFALSRGFEMDDVLRELESRE